MIATRLEDVRQFLLLGPRATVLSCEPHSVFESPLDRDEEACPASHMSFLRSLLSEKQASARAVASCGLEEVDSCRATLCAYARRARCRSSCTQRQSKAIENFVRNVKLLACRCLHRRTRHHLVCFIVCRSTARHGALVLSKSANSKGPLLVRHAKRRRSGRSRVFAA